MKIVLDCYGGDNSPLAMIQGAADALAECPDLELILTGNEAEIKAELAKLQFSDEKRLEIVHAPEVITNDDVPTDAIRQKRESSMVKAFEIAKERQDVVGMVTVGSTGAALTGGTLKLGRIRGIRRPALAPVLPTVKGGWVCLIDCGANVDCKPEFLEQFALMGSSYMRAIYGMENPRVALVSNGVEDKKGNELVHAAFPLLAALPINFVGNMEAREALSGEYDVLVCDGFVGNVLLKSVEGSIGALMKLLKGALKSNFRSKMGGLLIKPALKKMMKSLGYGEWAAAAFLGCNKLLAKAHGNADAKQIKIGLMQVKAMAEGQLTERITAEMEKL
ncbi:MAG: phosphate acyltransferase PlsX [Firmicutes bacterium]|nr:phosphate acyltransferase PlsX [Bacillota bacterium]